MFLFVSDLGVDWCLCGDLGAISTRSPSWPTHYALLFPK